MALDGSLSNLSQADLERLILDVTARDASKQQVNPPTSNRIILPNNLEYHYFGRLAEPPYEGDWEDRTDSVSRFRTNALYETELELDCKGGISGTAIGTLPEEYRPRYVATELMSDGIGGIGTVTVGLDGIITWTAIPGASTPSKWASYRGFFCDPTSPHTTATEYISFDEGITNDANYFGLALGAHGAYGVEFKKPGIYRTWAAINFVTHYDETIDPAEDFNAVMVFDYVSYEAALNHTYTTGTNDNTFQSAGNFAEFNTYLHADILAYPDLTYPPAVIVSTGGQPYNVVEMGMAQNTLKGGCWEVGYMVQMLHDETESALYPGDFSAVWYLNQGADPFPTDGPDGAVLNKGPQGTMRFTQDRVVQTKPLG